MAASRFPDRDELSFTVSGAIVQAFREHHIDVVFTVAGGPLMPWLRACHILGYPKVVSCRSETSACIMAGSYALERGFSAVALTSGPGAANAANGLIHCLREQLPVFVLSARPPLTKLGRGAVQDLDSARFLSLVTKRSEQLMHPSQSLHLVRQLADLAHAPNPGPVNLTITSDQWYGLASGAA